MLCRTCGGHLDDDPAGAWCPVCAFERALSRGGDIGDEESEGAPGSLSDRYEFLHELGRGAMGVVWLAREKALDRLVALKVAAPEAGPSWGARLLREGKAAASLRHPNIVAVFAMGREGTEPFLAMEFVEGGGLDARLKEGPLPVIEAAQIAEKMAGALAFAHGAGLLHRDIKPSNILMDENNVPRLADFGLAAALEGSGDLTQPGHIVGTPAYIAPELLRGADRAGPASDIYGLGAVLFACLTGRAPFMGDSAASILSQIPSAEPPPPRLLRPGIPRDVETICMKCLEKAPERRYASAVLLQADLKAFLEGRPITARPLGWAGRLARSCRRHPAFATSMTLTLLCLLALAIGGPAMALRLARAQASAEDRLRETLLDRSRATRLAAQIGQRNVALTSAVEAARIRPGLDARDEAIAALARPEIVPIRTWPISRYAESVITFNPDIDRYAMEAGLGILEWRTMSDNRLVQTFVGPKEKLWTYPFLSADGRKVVSRNGAGTLLVWSVDRSNPAWQVPDRPYVLNGRFKGYGQPDAFSPDGRVLASAVNGTGVSIMSADDGHELGRIPTDYEATHVAYSPDGRMLAVGRGLLSRDGRTVAFVRVYDAATLRKVSDLNVQGGFQSLAWAPEGTQILTTGGSLKLYQVSDGALLRSIDDPPDIRGFFGPFGTTLISNTTSGGITLWDLESGRPLLSGTLGNGVETGANQAGDLIATRAGTSNATLVRLEMSDVVRTLPPNDDRSRQNVLSAAVPTVDYSPDGRWLATGMWGLVQLRDRNGTVVARVKLGTLSNYTSVRFTADSKALLVGTMEEGLLRLPIIPADDAHAAFGESSVIDPELAGFVTDVSRDGGRALVTSFISGFVKVVPLDGSKGGIRWKLPGAGGAAFVNHGHSILANSLNEGSDAKIELRSAEDAHVERILPYPYGAHVAVSADGSLAVIGYGANGTALLDTTSWSATTALPAAIQGRGNPCAISPDGRTLAVGEATRVWLVNAGDGSVLAHLEGAQTGVYIPGLAFSPDGKQVAVLYDGGELSIWDLDKLQSELRSRGLGW